jgi:hypothetical protein
MSEASTAVIEDVDLLGTQVAEFDVVFLLR